MARKTWVQCRETGKLIPKDEYVSPEERDARKAHYHVQGDIEPFISHTDGSTINSRSDLREHHRRNGTTNIHDYGDPIQFAERSFKQRQDAMRVKTPEARRERIESLREIWERKVGH